MRIKISENCYLEASKITCDRVKEALELYDCANNLKPSEWYDWYEYYSELEYCYGRAAMLLGLFEPTEKDFECFGKF